MRYLKTGFALSEQIPFFLLIRLSMNTFIVTLSLNNRLC